jgi:hypothetical protein
VCVFYILEEGQFLFLYHTPFHLSLQYVYIFYFVIYLHCIPSCIIEPFELHVYIS